MEAIYKRRSIRRYTEERIKDEDIRQILKAGMAAPSTKGAQGWVFIVMRDRDQFGKFMDASEYAQALTTADTAILVCADLSRDEVLKEGWWIQDCSAALENMLLEATDLGIGSLWLGVYPRKERVDFVRELCELPDHVQPLGLVALGMAQKEKDPIDRYLEDQVFEGKYGVAYR